MSRKATDSVTTIGIDIGKNTFHLIARRSPLGQLETFPASPGMSEAGV